MPECGYRENHSLRAGRAPLRAGSAFLGGIIVAGQKAFWAHQGLRGAWAPGKRHGVEGERPV